jgi:hypothetical protein
MPPGEGNTIPNAAKSKQSNDSLNVKCAVGPNDKNPIQCIPTYRNQILNEYRMNIGMLFTDLSEDRPSTNPSTIFFTLTNPADVLLELLRRR